MSRCDAPSQRREGNLAHLLRQRETHSRPGVMAPPTLGSQGVDALQDLPRWVESDFLRRCSASYCPLSPAPRSTIAAAFSPDGTLIASTHGDHSVKIICCHTGKCIRVLNGHRRTPWVVRFHPQHPSLVVSGSLDHDVRLWNTSTGETINYRDFGRPIASLAFHPKGNVLAVASGHKLHIWEYNKGVQESSAPAACLRTRRSLRAVHFHPRGAPLLLTAEVSDPDPEEFPPSFAVSAQQQQVPASEQGAFWDASLAASAAFTVAGAAGVRPEGTSAGPSTQAASQSFNGSPSSSSTSASAHVPPAGHRHTPSPVPSRPSGSGQGSGLLSQLLRDGSAPRGIHTARAQSLVTPLGAPVGGHEESVDPRRARAPNPAASDVTMQEAESLSGSAPRDSRVAHEEAAQAQETASMEVESSDRQVQLQERRAGDLEGLPPTMVPMGWEMPADMLQRDILQQQRLRQQQEEPRAESTRERRRNSADSSNLFTRMAAAAPDRPGAQASAEAVAAATAAAAAIVPHERPCTVKLRLWHFDESQPRKPLDTPLLTITHTVLCSEMGVHFSPCGRYLAACVACRPNVTADYDPNTAAPIYELRVFSLEKATFGQILKAREVRAAHCLTSIQFSPASDHLLLAYGRRHISLLRSLVADGGSIIPVHTILEVYRVSDMSLVRVLPSAEDEVNVAAFHPYQGCGVAYGTKEGRLRILRYDRTSPRPVQSARAQSGRSLEDELLEADQMVESESNEESEEESSS